MTSCGVNVRRIRFTTGARDIPDCIEPTGDWTLYGD